MPRFPFHQIAVVCAIVFAGAGCASSTPQMDRRFGQSVQQLRAQQILYPAAALNADPANGLDGVSAAGSYDRYLKSFQNPEKQPSSSIIGGGSR